jgi:hypothetical protein
MGKRLVIDASIARSCGDDKATYPTSIHCRDFLVATQVSQHRIVITPDIKAEWDKHKSRFARQWLGSMIARKQVTRIANLSVDPELWNPIEKLAQNDSERAAMAKDILLLEAALATDRRIASLDENTARRYYKLAAQTIPKLREIVWVNPDKPAENPIGWLQAGAPADDFRMLGYGE